jgi:hypothetical protein
LANRRNSASAKKCADEKQRVDGVMEVELADVGTEVSFAKNIILPSKYLSICRAARGLLNKSQLIV